MWHGVLAIDVFKFLYFFPDQGHDTNSCQDMLSAESFTWYSISKGFSTLITRLAQMPHKKTDIGSEEFLRLAPEIPDQPLGIEGILRGHTISHNSVVERFSLPGIESQNFDVASNSGQQRGQRSVFFFFSVRLCVRTLSPPTFVVRFEL